jgi:NhaB family Na+:H+ antiporter
MHQPLGRALLHNFLGRAPAWYKTAILGFLAVNPLLLAAFGPFVTGWALVAQFIFTLAMALRCYPLQPGGLLALEAVALGLASPAAVYAETQQNFAVILLLVFMVAGIYFMRELLLFLFARLLVRVRSQMALALVFCATAALLSAFLDALTVMAVIVTVAGGFYAIWHRAASGRGVDDAHDHTDDTAIAGPGRADLEQLRAWLRGLAMHGAVGTALGGVATLVGEPQNLLIGELAGWDFGAFFRHVAPVSVPVIAAGLATCAFLEWRRLFGYGMPLPPAVREVLEQWIAAEDEQRSDHERMRLLVQGVVAGLLVAGLALHVAAVGLIGLAVIVLATAFCGVIEEKRLGHAFEEALPFTALLVTFFAVVAVIHEQHLFRPVIEYVLAQDGSRQLGIMFMANGVLSAISDNVFVATVYISDVKNALDAGRVSRAQFELLAVAINTGTNIPSIATPNGQAAFLFLLTSAVAPLIRLGYGRMIWMALPYTVVLTATGLIATLQMS